MSARKKKRERIFCCDGNWYLHRAFNTLHTKRAPEIALPQHLMSMVVKDALAVKADYLLVAFDGPKVFRYDVYPGYKGDRKEKKGSAPVDSDDDHEKVDIYTYLPYVYKLFTCAGIVYYQPKKHEADDVLHSISVEYGSEYSVVSGTQDKDAYQSLVQGSVRLYDASHKNKAGESDPIYIDAAMAEKYKGVKVSQMIDYQTLIGDKGDSIPAIYGMTPAKAAKILNQYGSIRNWYREDKESRKFLTVQQDNLKRNRTLVTLVEGVLPTTDLEMWKLPKIKPSGDFSRSYHEYHNWLWPKSKGLFG